MIPRQDHQSRDTHGRRLTHNKFDRIDDIADRKRLADMHALLRADLPAIVRFRHHRSRLDAVKRFTPDPASPIRSAPESASTANFVAAYAPARRAAPWCRGCLICGFVCCYPTSPFTLHPPPVESPPVKKVYFNSFSLLFRYTFYLFIVEEQLCHDRRFRMTATAPARM